jgi:hypothetical protein
MPVYNSLLYDKFAKKLGDDTSYVEGGKFSFFKDTLRAINSTLLLITLPTID